MTGNREYKSDVFSMLMEEPDNVYEHQSTYNPNMPLRSLFYLTDILKPMLGKKDLYSRHKIILPNPKFVVFYNGVEERPEYEELRLSDLYEHSKDNPELELICKVYNINFGKNNDLLRNCTILNQYMQFVDKVRENDAAGDEEAVRHAVEYSIDNHILENFLCNHKEEVIKNMCIDMTFERREVLIREEERIYGREEGRQEGRQEGQKEGRQEGRKEGLQALVRSLKPLIPNFENLYEVVMKNEVYSDCTREEVFQIYEKC